MSKGDRQPRFVLTFDPQINADLLALAKVDPRALDAAQSILDDIAHGRIIGKMLGTRLVSGDLTTLARVKFDLPDERPQRFRILYRQPDDKTREVIAIGLREDHSIYRLAVQRLGR